MKFEHLENILRCETDILTLDEMTLLNQTEFAHDVPVSFHFSEIDQQALNSFLNFISKLKCLNIKVYFETLNYETAQTICEYARKNSHTLKMKLDLGEHILAFISSQVLNNSQCQDICDHLISGVYRKLHTLIVSYRYMNYVQAISLCKALFRTSLQTVEIDNLILDNQTKEYLIQQLTTKLTIPDTHLLIGGKEQLRQESDIALEIKEDLKNTEESEGSDDEDVNCLQKALTWMLSLVTSNRTSVPNIPTSEQEPRRHHPKMH
ncbi:MAG: hypothetical protein AB7I18_01360 [Candidatus Berkiella sp.]